MSVTELTADTLRFIADTVVLNVELLAEPSDNREDVMCLKTSVVPVLVLLKHFLSAHAVWVLKRRQPALGSLGILNLFL